MIQARYVFLAGAAWTNGAATTVADAWTKLRRVIITATPSIGMTSRPSRRFSHTSSGSAPPFSGVPERILIQHPGPLNDCHETPDVLHPLERPPQNHLSAPGGCLVLSRGGAGRARRSGR